MNIGANIFQMYRGPDIYTYFQWTENGQCFQIQYLILDPEVRLWNEELKRLRENEKKQTIAISIAA